MLNILGMKLEGRHHSGIDDCKNIARIAIVSIRSGHETTGIRDLIFFAVTNPINFLNSK